MNQRNVPPIHPSPFIIHHSSFDSAAVAQAVEALDSKSGCWGFESLAQHFKGQRQADKNVRPTDYLAASSLASFSSSFNSPPSRLISTIRPFSLALAALRRSPMLVISFPSTLRIWSPGLRPMRSARDLSPTRCTNSAVPSVMMLTPRRVLAGGGRNSPASSLYCSSVLRNSSH